MTWSGPGRRKIENKEVWGRDKQMDLWQWALTVNIFASHLWWILESIQPRKGTK